MIITLAVVLFAGLLNFMIVRRRSQANEQNQSGRVVPLPALFVAFFVGSQLVRLISF